MDLSVIVVTHDSAAYIEPCIRSLLASEAGGFELLVVDNCSRDGTADLVSASFPAVKLLIPASPGGFARNVNIGFQAGRGKYVLVLNPDTEVRPDTLRRLAIDLDEHPKAAVVGPRLVSADRSLQRSYRRFPTLGRALLESLLIDRLLPRRTESESSKPFPVDWLAGACLLVRRAAIEGGAGHPPVGLLDERFFLFVEDIEWCFRMRQAGWEVIVDPALSILHHKGSGHGWDEWRYTMACQGMIAFFRKHRGSVAATIYELILFFGLLLRAGIAIVAFVAGRPRRRESIERLRGYVRLAARLATGSLAQSSAVP